MKRGTHFLSPRIQDLTPLVSEEDIFIIIIIIIIILQGIGYSQPVPVQNFNF
jgi:hypothetical protein